MIEPKPPEGSVLETDVQFLPAMLEDLPEIVSAEQVDEPVRRDETKATRLSLSSDKERRYFSLSPLYQALSVPFDLLTQYAADSCGRDRRELSPLVHYLPLRIFPELAADQHVLQSVAASEWDALWTWIGLVNFTHPIAGLVGVNRWTVVLEDPTDEANPRGLLTIGVPLPWHGRGELRPRVEPQGRDTVVRLSWVRAQVRPAGVDPLVGF